MALGFNVVGRRYCVIRCTVGSSSRSVLFCIWQDCNQKALMHFAFSPTFVPHPRYSTLDSSINSSINEECFYLNLFAVLTFILFIPIIIQARLLWILHWEWRLILYSCFDLHSETGTTDTQREFFFRKSQTFGLGDTNWAEKFGGVCGIFGHFISTHFCTVSPFFMFSINQQLFLQKTKPLYPNPKYLFGIYIWIRDLAFVCS